MRKAIYVAILLVALAVPVYASSFGDSLSGSGNWGLKVANALKGGKGLYGQSTNTEGGGIGVQGVSTGRTGRGVYGLASRGGGKSIGVFGESRSNQGKGVMGFASKASGTTYGVYGRANSPDGWGLYTPNNAYVGGMLGIGETNPIYPLDVEGNARFEGNYPTIRLYGTESKGRLWMIREWNGDFEVLTWTSGWIPRLRITHGNVVLPPTNVPGTCDSSTKGGIYYDSSLAELCDCNGVSWGQVDGGGAC
jgi:hypothetical protein